MPRPPVQYDTLLRIRQLQEDLHAAALAASRRQVRRAQEQRAELMAQRHDVLDTAGQRAREHPVAAELRAYYQYERRLARLTDEKDAEVVQLREVAEHKRGELEQAMKQRRIVERLRERRIEAYEAEVRREEQKASDEVAQVCRVMATNAAAWSRSAVRSGASRKPNRNSAVRSGASRKPTRSSAVRSGASRKPTRSSAARP